MALNGFRVLLLVSTPPEVLVKFKKDIYTAFCPLILRLKLSYNPLKTRFTMTWLPHYTITQIRKGKEMTGQKS